MLFALLIILGIILLIVGVVRCVAGDPLVGVVCIVLGIFILPGIGLLT